MASTPTTAPQQRPQRRLRAAARRGLGNGVASMDIIRKHAADARWLDALDALDALSAEEIDDAALAAEVRHHGERFRSARNAFEDPDDDNHQWQGRTERFGVETAFRYDEDGLLWLKTAGNMEDVDLFHTVAVLREIQLFGEWIPFLRQSCVVKAQDFARLLAHFTIGTARAEPRLRLPRRGVQPRAVGRFIIFRGAELRRRGHGSVWKSNLRRFRPRDRYVDH